jgi:hypothetical protein
MKQMGRLEVSFNVEVIWLALMFDQMELVWEEIIQIFYAEKIFRPQLSGAVLNV